MKSKKRCLRHRFFNINSMVLLYGKVFNASKNGCSSSTVYGFSVNRLSINRYFFPPMVLKNSRCAHFPSSSSSMQVKINPFAFEETIFPVPLYMSFVFTSVFISASVNVVTSACISTISFPMILNSPTFLTVVPLGTVMIALIPMADKLTT